MSKLDKLAQIGALATVAVLGAAAPAFAQDTPKVDTGDAAAVDGVRIDRARAGGVVEERLHGGHLHTGSVLPRDGLPPELDGPSG